MSSVEDKEKDTIDVRIKVEPLDFEIGSNVNEIFFPVKNELFESEDVSLEEEPGSPKWSKNNKTEVTNWDFEGTDKLWSEEYEAKVIKTLESSTQVEKNRKFYYLKNNFKVVKQGCIKKVARIKDNRLMAKKSEVFSIVKNIHNGVSHKGEKKTYKKVAEIYGNIPMSVIKSFINQCKICAGKSMRTSGVAKPKIVVELKQRGEVDLLDFQNYPDGEYRFVLKYQQINTKFVCLVPLRTNTGKEVAKTLLSIFLQFGPPHVLHSGNNREFTSEIIKELELLWIDLVIVNGTLQRKNEKNNSLKETIITWMQEHNIPSWSSGLGFVQWFLNTTYNEVIKMTPHEAVFGHKPRMGLQLEVPLELLNKIKNGIYEEDLIEVIKSNPMIASSWNHKL